MSKRRFSIYLLVLAAGCGSSNTGDPAVVVDSGIADSVATESAVDAAGDPVVTSMQRYLTGEFDSADQAKADPAYFEIHLAVCQVEVPALGEHVLYVEQARADSLNAPYRQRLYVLERKGDKGVSRVFELKLPSKAKGWCKDVSRLALTAADVEERAGCAVELTWDGTAFEGGTHGKDCLSTLSGATYATSEVTLDAAGMKSWDRGFDATDKQVWGATKGAYVFVRRTTLGD